MKEDKKEPNPLPIAKTKRDYFLEQKIKGSPDFIPKSKSKIIDE